MSGEIQDLGAKGKFIGKLIIGFIVFISLWAFVYYKNGVLQFPIDL